MQDPGGGVRTMLGPSNTTFVWCSGHSQWFHVGIIVILLMIMLLIDNADLGGYDCLWMLMMNENKYISVAKMYWRHSQEKECQTASK